MTIIEPTTNYPIKFATIEKAAFEETQDILGELLDELQRKQLDTIYCGKDDEEEDNILYYDEIERVQDLLQNLLHAEYCR